MGRYRHDDFRMSRDEDESPYSPSHRRRRSGIDEDSPSGRTPRHHRYRDYRPNHSPRSSYGRNRSPSPPPPSRGGGRSRRHEEATPPSRRRRDRSRSERREHSTATQASPEARSKSGGRDNGGGSARKGVKEASPVSESGARASPALSRNGRADQNRVSGLGLAPAINSATATPSRRELRHAEALKRQAHVGNSGASGSRKGCTNEAKGDAKGGGEAKEKGGGGGGKAGGTLKNTAGGRTGASSTNRRMSENCAKFDAFECDQ